MLMIRLPKASRGKAWRAMIEVGPVRLIALDPIYDVLPIHLGVLAALGFKFEVLPRRLPRAQKRRHGTAE